MKAGETQSSWGSTFRGLIHMRISELATTATLVRFTIAFVIVFGLTFLIGSKSDSPQFWNLATYFFALGFLPFYCLVKGGESLRSELKEGTIEFLWTRPVRRSSLFLGFYASSLIGIGAFTTVCLVALSGAGLWLGEISSAGQIFMYCLGCLTIALSFSALSLSFGSLTSKFVVIGILYYFFIEKLLAQVPTNARKVSIIANLKPHFLANAEQSSEIVFTSAAHSILYVIATAAIALILGGIAFTLKRYSLGDDK